jgi:two-component system response regulator MprA
MHDSIDVLIADDQPHLSLALEHLVRSIDGVRATAIADGSEAIHHAIDEQPDLVILSTTIGPIDAWTAARMIRDQWHGHPGRIWLSAGRLEPYDNDDLTTAGVDHIVTHPYDPNEVIDRITEVIRAQAR